jgi:pyruvate formate lyase activating enzyme
MENRMLSRRDFLATATKTGLIAGSSIFLPGAIWDAHAVGAGFFTAYDVKDNRIKLAPRARYWISTAAPNVDCRKCHKPGDALRSEGHKGKPVIIKCLLCAQTCTLRTGERGRCRARMNVDGELRSLVYGRPVSIHVDPIEKKPFYHFLPGSDAFSFATSGCPLRCKFCQNWEISQSSPEDFNTTFIPPADMVRSASAQRAPVIAFTYNEPTVFLEYLADVAALARKKSMRCVMVSCGFMNSEPLDEMCHLLDAIKIDLKGYSPDFYRNVCGAEMQPVLNSIRQIAKSGVHLEIVNLVVPTLNDSEKMSTGLIDWVMGELGPDIPIHFTRFHPDYQLLNLPPTPVATLDRFRNLAMSKGIRYAYVGNVPDSPGNNTYCPQCGKAVIKRNSFFVAEMNVHRGCCKSCGKAIAGVWQ